MILKTKVAWLCALVLMAWWLTFDHASADQAVHATSHVLTVALSGIIHFLASL